MSSIAERWGLRGKGLLVVCIPIAFQISLIVALLYVEGAYQRDERLERQSKDAIDSTLRLIALATEIQSRTRGYAATLNPALAGPFDQRVAQFSTELENLSQIVKQTPSVEDDRLLAELGRPAKDLISYYVAAVKDVRAGRNADVLARMSAGIGQRLRDRFQSASDDLLAAERLIDVRRSAAAAAGRTRINVALIGGGALSVAVAAILTVLFTNDIARRIGVVVNNMARLERNESLPPPIGGSDEIAALDQRFHDMAAALAEADAQWKRAEEDLRRFFTLSFEMLCIAGFDGYFKLLNPAWERALGHPLSYLYSKPFMEFVHPDDRRRTITETKQLNDGVSSVSFENRYRHADGSYRWLLWHARAYTEGGIIYAAASDITQRKQFESTLGDRNEALEKANRELESFSYSVSHDLRSPLRAIDGYARILEEDYSANLDDEGRRVLSVIRSESRRMGLLIDDLLAFSRLGRQSLNIAPVDLGVMAEQIITEKRRKYPEKQIEFVRGDAPLALADAAAIRHVVFNLIANAVKYSKPGEPVHIEFGGEARDGADYFWIRDRGIGFDQKYAEKIFGVFQRLHSSGEIEGSGVGLAIVQRIVERHRGRVWAEADRGKGAAFFFTLPNTAEEETREEEVH